MAAPSNVSRCDRSDTPNIYEMSNKNENSSKELLNIECNLLESKLLLKKKKTYRPEPSSVLQSVKDFLPAMADANKVLEKTLVETPHKDVDIENIQNFDGPIIEMNLALFERDSGSDEDSELDSSDEEGEMGKSPSNTSDDDDDDDSVLLQAKQITETNLKLTRTRQKKPVIEEIETMCNSNDNTLR
ncbi:uncharacterized protein LOC100372848 [Saccoglossus kowalevskii]|uniref:Uncharacterized protein C12orf45 homolog n=1 Tax=Saccoglossus kowalevskii TaxID=10224 RepID=A0ABM0GZ25_SACKO|nr:PREDICTED: uncharacterized protein C12orf45 homolog [Saccoglossus kowalevskii]